MEIPSSGVTINVTAGTCCSIWSASTVPPAPLDDGDTSSVELGTKFRADTDGFITAVRFYKASANTGTHTGSLWTGTGTLLGTVTFTGETASGWQQANFASAIPITANTTYVVSYHAPVGHYTGTDPFFTTAVDNSTASRVERRDGWSQRRVCVRLDDPVSNEHLQLRELLGGCRLHARRRRSIRRRRRSRHEFPALERRASTRPPDHGDIQRSDERRARISSSTTGSEGGNSPGTFELRDPSNNLVTAAVSYDSASKTATLTPGSSLALSTTIHGDREGRPDRSARERPCRKRDGRERDLVVHDRRGTPPPPSSCPCSIWPPTTVPNPVDDNDPSSVVLGTRFRSDVPGYITGARFYKGTLNTGTHVATLWTNTGTQLATATFSGETASGWQQVSFATPVPIAANTTYVISYLAPKGHYSAPDNYFAAAGIRQPAAACFEERSRRRQWRLRLQRDERLPDSDITSPRATSSTLCSTPTNGPDVTPPAVKSVSPPAGASGVFTNTSVIVTFNEPVDPTTINTNTILLRDSSGTAVPATVTYDGSLKTATLTPTSVLPYSSTFTPAW